MRPTLFPTRRSGGPGPRSRWRPEMDPGLRRSGCWRRAGARVSRAGRPPPCSITGGYMEPAGTGTSPLLSFAALGTPPTIADSIGQCPSHGGTDCTRQASCQYLSQSGLRLPHAAQYVPGQTRHLLSPQPSAGQDVLRMMFQVWLAPESFFREHQGASRCLWLRPSCCATVALPAAST